MVLIGLVVPATSLSQAPGPPSKDSPGASKAPPPTAEPDVAPSPAAPDAETPLPEAGCDQSGAGCAPAATPAPEGPAHAVRKYRRVRVLSVVDGDTLRVRLRSGGRRTVRLLGIDAPAVATPDQPAACGAQTARTYLTRLTRPQRKRKTLTLTTDVVHGPSDRLGRLLAYASRGRTDYGRKMIGSGRARLDVEVGEFSRRAVFTAAQSRARAAKRGSWRTCWSGTQQRTPR